MATQRLNCLGISLNNKGGAALVMDGQRVLASAIETRARARRSVVLPEEAVSFCLKQARLNWSDINVIGIQSRHAPDWADFISSQFGADRGWFESLWSLPANFREELRFRNQLREGLADLRGAASAANPLPSLVLSSDELAVAQGIFHQQADPGAGVLVLTPPFAESDTGLWVGKAAGLEQLWRVEFVHSLEQVVRNLAAYSGFRGRWGERQFLRLAEYGEPTLQNVLRQELITWSQQGELQVQVDRLVREPQNETQWSELRRLLDASPRSPEQPISSRELDLSRSLLGVIDQWANEIFSYLRDSLQIQNLFIRGHGPVADRLRHISAAGGLRIQFVAGQEDPLFMAAGAAIQAWRGHSEDNWLFHTLNLKPAENFQQYLPPPRVSL